MKVRQEVIIVSKMSLIKALGLEGEKSLPIISYPSTSILGYSVKDLTSDSVKQAQAIATVAARTKSSAAVNFMDLSVEAETFGSEIRFSETEIPTVIGSIVHDGADVAKLKIPEIGDGRTGVYVEAISLAKKAVTDKPLLAGMIGPFSLAGRLVGVSEAMMYCYDDPEGMSELLEKCSVFLTAYAKAFKSAGADGIIMAEPLTGMLSPALAEEFSTPFVKRIVKTVQDSDFSIVYHNCGNNTVRMTETIADTGADAFHFGNAVSMLEALEKMPSDRFVLGNVDPSSVMCYGTPESVRKTVTDQLETCTGHKNYVISTGCDVPPLTPWANIDAFFEAVSDFYKK